MFPRFCLHCVFERECYPLSGEESEDDGDWSTRRAVLFLMWYAVPASSSLKMTQ